MMDVGQFRTLVVRPILQYLTLHSPAAENLLIGTALQESGLIWLSQHPTGPARGVYQIEPATHADLYATWIPATVQDARRRELRQRLVALCAPAPSPVDQLRTNLAYATAVARLLYYRHPDPLPAADDVDGLAAYYKCIFNSTEGAATSEQWAAKYRRWGQPTES